MRTKAGESLTLADIAKETGVSARTLQAGFKHFRSQSPMAYLRDYRLDQVKAALKKAGPDVRVSAIAWRWGFSNMSRFASLYSERFGEKPRDTLRFR